MGSNTTNINIRLDRDLKAEAEELFAELGMNLTTALNIFLRQAVRQGKIPFEVSAHRPNAETLAAIQEIEDMKNGLIPKNSMSVEEFIKEMSK